MTDITTALRNRGFEVDPTLLGKGAFGEVLKAKSQHDGQTYAIKIVPLENKNTEKYLERELELLIRLKLSETEGNIIKYFKSWILDVGNKERLCIQMELCCLNLQHFVSYNEIAGASIVDAKGQPRFYQQVFRQILSGLDKIHSLGWVHRDIHPGNILIANPNPKQISDINVKIADFGLARHIGVGFYRTVGLTVLPQCKKLSPIVGNPLFRAPEIRTEHYDFKVDVYSAGMVLYYISYYLADTSQWTSELEALKNGNLDIEEKLRDKNDEKLCYLIKNLLQHDPTKRLSARDAKECMLPRQAKDSVDASEVSINFFAKKNDEEDLRRCYLTEFTLSGIREAVELGTGVEIDRQDLRQTRMVNGEKSLIMINRDEDVKAMFVSAKKDGCDVVLVVRENPVYSTVHCLPTFDSGIAGD